MLSNRIEGKWIDAFTRVFELCRVNSGDPVAILSETQSREINVRLAELALHRLGARAFHIIVPTPPQTEVVPIRSTGATTAIQKLGPVVKALSEASMVIDITIEGMLHAPETPQILEAGSRVFYISNEHPELLERCMPTPELKGKVEKAKEMTRAASRFEVRSDAGTDLTINLDDAAVGGGCGVCDQPGTRDYWPGGLIACFPRAGAVNGTLVMDRGDINLTFKRYLERPIALTIKDDYVTEIEGEGVDAELMRSYLEVWQDKDAYATSHVGWGMNPRARWDALVMYDKGDINGSEQRAFAGNFLYSTGANEFADRFTLGHFDLPVRNCTMHLDGQLIVERGILQSPLA